MIMIFFVSCHEGGVFESLRMLDDGRDVEHVSVM